MKILNLFILLTLVLSVSCGGIKERKKDNGNATAENVESYPEYYDYESDDIKDENLEANNSSDGESTLLKDSEDGKTYLSTDEERSSNNSNTTDNNQTSDNSNSGSNTADNTNTENTGSNTANNVNQNAGRTVSMYYVVGGSFQDMPKARRLKKQLRKEGYQAEILEPFQGYNRVAVAQYRSKEDALKTISKVRRQYTKMTFWLLAEYE